MGESIRLKPCPFCGRPPRLEEFIAGSPYNDGKNNDYSASIVCDCGLTYEREWTVVRVKDGTVKLHPDIFQAWNTRDGEAKL